jgi:pyruvate/2-oxoglutarate dehydrogenase complex dihydrolipoamide dehydrogenase (E3) component
MPQSERYDDLVLGSGQGGKVLAWDLARSGRRTACVERKWIGGSCPNIACMPSKNEVWSARIAHIARHAAQFGAKTGAVAIDMERIRQRKRDMVEREVAYHVETFKRTGAELIMGDGRFIAPKTVEVKLDDGATRFLAAERVFLNLGSHAAMPNVPGLAAARPLTHVEALELDYAPAHLIVLGGGYVGIEMAQAYRRFGSRVTVIESGPRVMGREDPDVSEEIQRILGEEGIRFLLSAEARLVEGHSGREVSVTLRASGGEETLVGSDILVAAGRAPNTPGIGLEEAGVALDARGYIRVNERLETTAPGVWALGECAGSPQFTHISVDDFRIIHANLAGGTRSTRDRLVPYCVFTDPPLARVGLSEGEARRNGVAVRIAKLPMSSVLRTATTDETQGFMKALVGAVDDRVLGFTIIGSEAGEVMAAVEMAMLADLPYQRLRDAVIAHLTIAEGLGSLFANVPPRSEG